MKLSFSFLINLIDLPSYSHSESWVDRISPSSSWYKAGINLGQDSLTAKHITDMATPS